VSPRYVLLCTALAMAALSSPSSRAANADEPFVVTLKNHAFAPQVLTVPADRKIRVTIRNADQTPAEFESNSLNREKIVGPNAEITVFIGPLKAGSYAYYDDFHRTTTGTIEARKVP